MVDDRKEVLPLRIVAARFINTDEKIGLAELTRIFADALNEMCLNLAQLVVRDGEGAQKFIAITTRGAVSDESARRIGLAIANSPLFKTAMAGEDANWGRIAAAAGAAGEPLDRDRLSISFGGIRVAKNGEPVNDYDEDSLSAYLRFPEIEVLVDLDIDRGQATVWTCDLTHEYIAINAHYRN